MKINCIKNITKRVRIKPAVSLHTSRGQKQMYGLFIPSSKKALVFVVDTVRTNQMPNMNALYNAEYNTKCVFQNVPKPTNNSQ